MIRPNATSIPAKVVYLHASWNRAYPSGVRPSMGVLLDGVAVDFVSEKLPVAVPVAKGNPLPAVAFDYLGKEALSDSRSGGQHMCRLSRNTVVCRARPTTAAAETPAHLPDPHRHPCVGQRVERVFPGTEPA